MAINKNITIQIISTTNGYILEYKTCYEQRVPYGGMIPPYDTKEIYPTLFTLFDAMQRIFEGKELLPPINVRSLEEDIKHGTY